VLLGADPLSDVPDASLARKALANVGSLIAVDTVLTPSNKGAAVFLPATTAGEHGGTTTNLEGRVTALAQKVTAGTPRPDWMIAVELGDRLGHDLGFTTLDEVTHELSVTVDAFAPATAAALAAERNGVLLDLGGGLTVTPSRTEPPVPSSYEYRLVVSRKLYDAGQTVAHSASLAHLAPGARLHLHPLDADRLGATAGSLVKVTSARTTLTLAVEPDAAIARSTAWVAFNQPNASAAELIDGGAWAIDVKVESL
jgi:NADH-quinone oxidoreductase subunit G